jgi:hypothetical protein
MPRDDRPPLPDPDEELALSALDDDTTSGSAEERRREDPAKGSRHGDGRSRELPEPEVGDWNRYGAPRGTERDRRDDA